MKKSSSIAIILLVALLLASCYQYVFVPVDIELTPGR